MTWTVLNAFASLVVFGAIAYILSVHGHVLNAIERIGFGLTGAGAILTIGAVLSRQNIVSASPFDDWSGTLMRVGIMLSVTGKIVRLKRHERRNREAVEQADAYLRARGKR